jgi:hypothetical protein
VIDLLDVLGEPAAPMDWIIARVATIEAGPPPRLTLVVGDIGDTTAVHMRSVPYLDTYSPVVGDVVHVLTKRDVGSLVLGKSAT